MSIPPGASPPRRPADQRVGRTADADPYPTPFVRLKIGSGLDRIYYRVRIVRARPRDRRTRRAQAE